MMITDNGNILSYNLRLYTHSMYKYAVRCRDYNYNFRNERKKNNSKMNERETASNFDRFTKSANRTIKINK